MLRRKYLSAKSALKPEEVFELCFFLLALCFAAGAILGCFMGINFTDNSFLSKISPTYPNGSGEFLSRFLGLTVFSLIAAFLGSSFLGFAILPILTGARGYVLSFSAASMMASSDNKGIIMALLVFGIPALISLPCFFAVTVDAALASRRLKELMRGRFVPSANKLMLHFLISLPFLAVGALLEMKLVPYLVSLIT